MERADVVVIGAGFGGLGAATAAAEQGARVVLLERVGYPGGCASTFTRGGARYEAGATVLAGLGEGQALRDVVDRYALPLTLERVDPALTLRWPTGSFTIPSDRSAFVDAVAALPGAPPGVRRAFAEQQRVADALWATLDRPELLPPWGVRQLPGLLAHVAHTFGAWPALARHAGRPMSAWLHSHGLSGFEPLRRILDPLCQITVQVGTDQAEAPFALAAIDFLFRGVRSVRGGVGALATGLCDVIERLGGSVRFHRPATALTRGPDGWVVHTKRGPIGARQVVANVAPHVLRDWLGPTPRLDAQVARVETGWGAVVAYHTLDDAFPAGPAHLDLVADPAAPLADGNHVLCSVGEHRPGQPRTATSSTHVTSRDRAAVEAAQRALRATVRALAPELAQATRSELPASPRTFARFTGRPGGWVGGIPRRAGLGAYAELWPRAVAPGLWAVGDSVLLGQSALAAFVGGRHTARCFG
ncbi:MAG: FAD-dependent oxidoreductase [Myxococcota bacterium]